jgi:hypothetical protein
MSIWDFVKSAGKALGIGKEDTPPSAEDLKKELDSYKLGTEKVKVEVQGDKAIVTGDVADQSVLEKAIIAVGNTLGISKVESKLTAPSQKDPVFYTVKKGDNLFVPASSRPTVHLYAEFTPRPGQCYPDNAPVQSE